MTVVRPYSFEDLQDRVVPGKERVGLEVGPNTTAFLTDSGLAFEVFLHGNRIAVLWADGRVRVERAGHITGSTRARLNDCLHPLGWRISLTKSGWTVRTSTPPYRSMEFVDGMSLTSTYTKDH